jgi:glycosyltransferase involved in cell wall biosynthesis
VVPKGIYSGALKGIWRSLGICGDIKRDRVAVFHGLSNELPFGIGRTDAAKVVTIHDLIFRRFPQYYPALDRRIYDFKSRYECRHADVVVAVSEQTKHDIVESYRIAPEKIKVVYQCCDPSFSRSVAENDKSAVRSRYNLPAQFVLYVGSIEERKNLLGLVKAVALLRKSHDLFLVAIGRGTSYLEKVEQCIASSGMSERVMIRSDVAFSDFPAIYQLSQAFVYPSHFEGFGIPIIEALWSKTPVITTRGGCFAEAGGSASMYVSPDSPEEIAGGLSKVLGDSNLRARMIGGGYAHVQKFREEAVTRQMMELYRSLVSQ